MSVHLAVNPKAYVSQIFAIFIMMGSSTIKSDPDDIGQKKFDESRKIPTTFSSGLQTMYFFISQKRDNF